MILDTLRHFVVAAPHSGSGKTTITRMLMEGYVAEGHKVQPFKCGPDYIDTKFHERVCARPSVNLDIFMSSPSHIKETYQHYASDADVTIIEGMMGLYDGYDRAKGSTAEIAKILDLPVVLVVDARSTAYSLTALIRGIMSFDTDVHFAGIIFNQVGSEKHKAMLQQVADDAHVSALAFVNKDSSLEISSRYLGLDFSKIGKVNATKEGEVNEKASNAVFLDGESFSFAYTETLDALKNDGGYTVIDAARTKKLPESTKTLYLPGGYPEKHIDELAANTSLIQSVRDFAKRGGHIHAECGGMIYLCQSVVTDDGEYPLCGLLPYKVSARKEDRKLSLGYRSFVLDGKEYRGHEFHYTQFIPETPPSVCQVYDAKGNAVDTPVFRQGNIFASYIHNTLFAAAPRESEPHHTEAKTPAIFFAGTGSDVGKSILAAAFCRIFKQDGYSPAPFKAQNMALNSYATPEGLEIGRAQAVQAEAAGIPCHTDMNPLLLKPQSDHTSQVILNGKPVGNSSAYDYFRKEGREELRRAVCEAYDRLAKRHSPIVMEGAGSISEINLRHSDIVNMPMAQYANASVILVADIDRGGVFASVYGSIMLQTPEDRQRIKGVIINKFRGDLRLFEEGRKQIEQLCGIPVLGVVPYMTDIHIEEEDSVALTTKSMMAEFGKVNIAVVLLRHISNYTDFDSLERDERVHLYYTNNITELEKADIIIVPGTKSTLADLYELRRNGVAQAIIKAHREGKTILGICGGYQMLGTEVKDPEHTEGEIERLPGIGLLPTSTILTQEKVTKQVRGKIDGYKVEGYEIHTGVTTYTKDATPLIYKDDGTTDGVRLSDKCMGTYLHGILDNKAFVDMLLQPFADETGKKCESLDYHDYKEQQYNLLAEHIRKYVDTKKIYEIVFTRR
jgi:adenosylcobyric acid synthase